MNEDTVAMECTLEVAFQMHKVGYWNGVVVSAALRMHMFLATDFYIVRAYDCSTRGLCGSFLFTAGNVTIFLIK